MRVQYAERRPGATRFSAPTAVRGFPATPNAASFSFSEDALTTPVALPDGRIAISYQRTTADATEGDSVVFVTP